MYFDDTFEDMDKLEFSFRLYDVDNNGVVDMEEVTAIIETLDSIEGVKPGPKQILYTPLFNFFLRPKIPIWQLLDSECTYIWQAIFQFSAKSVGGNRIFCIFCIFFTQPR